MKHIPEKLCCIVLSVVHRRVFILSIEKLTGVMNNLLPRTAVQSKNRSNLR